MKTKFTIIVLTGIAAATLMTGCETVNTCNPHYGTQYRDGMEAIGHVARPYARPNAPINQDPVRSMNAPRGYGTLLDLMGGL